MLPKASPNPNSLMIMMRRRAVTAMMLIALVCATTGAEARIPARKQMQEGCVKTGGQWRELAAECDHMHPRSWQKLNREQQQNCMAAFHEPCECGKGKRFVYMEKIGCEESRFPSDQ